MESRMVQLPQLSELGQDDLIQSSVDVTRLGNRKEARMRPPQLIFGEWDMKIRHSKVMVVFIHLQMYLFCRDNKEGLLEILTQELSELVEA